MSNKISRREFIGQASCAAVGSTALASTLLNLLLTASASAGAVRSANDYKAIVCLFLPGGNDSYNLLVPRGVSEHQEYSTVRQDLALPREQLLPINPINNPGRLLGVHPGAGPLQQLFEAGNLAFVANIGSLVRPTTKADFEGGQSLPYGLFSHSDQIEQWQTSIPDERSGIGWAGRAADLLEVGNADSPISMNISISGNNLLQVGNDVVPYSVSEWGATRLEGYNDWNENSPIRTEAMDGLLAAEYSNVLERTLMSKKKVSLEAYALYEAATAGALPAGVQLPDNSLGRSLMQVLKLINGRQLLGAKRQVFYVQWGGWDFHDDVLQNMAAMIPIVSQAVKAFYDATVLMGLSQEVTLFSASEFGRSLTSNAKGSDHAWGGNQFVVGGSVKGKRVYGNFPDLFLGSSLDTGRGVLIPTTSVDQYAAELALWLGVQKSSLPYVLPNIGRFHNLQSSTPPLGFLL